MAKVLSVKIREKGYKGPLTEYKNKIILNDFRQLALILLDLETHGGNIEKAFLEYRKLKDKELWPFE